MAARISTLLASLLLVAGVAGAETDLRIATYNIKFLDADTLGGQGDRESKLEQVIADLGADVLALQEIDDRRALRRIFRHQDWFLIIDEDSGDTQDVALAVRRTLELPQFSGNEDADDEHFLFPDSSDNSAFPRRRDVLAVDVRVPGESFTFTAMVMHTKSRFGGRTTTEHRRVAASVALVQRIGEDFDGSPVVVLGDFNDTPDDRSLNVLETGSANAGAASENQPGAFLRNVTEPRYAEGHVTFGLKSNDISNGVIDTVDASARQRNMNSLGSDDHTGDQMFDQILLSPEMLDFYVADSAEVFSGGDAARGNNTTRASDHLPVFADFVVTSADDDEDGVTDLPFRIVGLLPNPHGVDAGNERVTVRNVSSADSSLAGWTIIDRAENSRSLDGTVPAGEEIVVTLSGAAMLNNSGGGDTVRLLSPAPASIEADEVTYAASQVASGVVIEFSP